MASFDIADEIARLNEGQWQNLPSDPGNGPDGLGTYRGVSSSRHPKWRGWHTVAAEIAKLPPQPACGTKGYKDWVKQLNAALRANDALQDMVRDFYKVNFWDALRLDDIRSQGAANQIYDASVNRGTGTAAILLQKILGVMADGVVGPVTIKAANKMRDNELEALYRAARRADYERIIKINPKLAQFRRTWLARC